MYSVYHYQGGAIGGRKGSVLPSSPVGSIAGFVMVFFLFLAVSVFCYRKGCGGSGGYGTLFAREGEIQCCREISHREFALLMAFCTYTHGQGCKGCKVHAVPPNFWNMN